MNNMTVETLRPMRTFPLAQQYESDPRGDGTVAELVQYVLDRHHAYLKAELPRLEGLLVKLAAIPCNRDGAMLHRLRRVFEEFKIGVELHMHKEEAVLFPAILQMERAVQAGAIEAGGSVGSFSNVIRMMSREHDSAEAEMDHIREITNDYSYPEDAGEKLRTLLDGLRALDADLRFHVHLEDDVLFERALRLAAGGTPPCP